MFTLEVFVGDWFVLLGFAGCVGIVCFVVVCVLVICVSAGFMVYLCWLCVLGLWILFVFGVLLWFDGWFADGLDCVFVLQLIVGFVVWVGLFIVCFVS